MFSAERGFLPHVQGSAGHSQFGVHAAGPKLARLAVDPAAFGAKMAILVSKAEWVVFNPTYTALTRLGAFCRTFSTLAFFMALA